MTSATRHARPAGEPNALLAVALVLPLVLVAVILIHARRAEQQRRDLADRVLRDYAAIAAWQLESHLRSGFHDLVTMSMRVVAGHEGDSGGRPGASVLLGQDTVACALVPRARFAFRYDPATGELEVAERDGSPPAAAVHAARRAAISALAQARSSQEPHRIVFDTAAGESRVYAMFVPPHTGDRRLVYGLETGLQPYERVLANVLERQHVLPPHLVRAPYGEDKLAVRVTGAGAETLLARGAAFALRHEASDTLPTFLGGLVMTVGLAPALAESLIVGGLPPSRMPAMLTLLALAVGLAGAALLQHRRARELDRARSRFVANVSHELRTPLTQISMFAETLMLERERSRDERLRFAGVIHREAVRLATLVEGVLRFSRGGAGAPALALQRTPIAAELGHAIDQFAPMAAAASSRLVLDVEDGLHADVEPGALRQILLNLLENAVKYGPEGQRILVAARRRGTLVAIAVEDEGPGIAESDRARVFEPFRRLESARRVPGTGIGLTVVRDLVRGMHGVVRVEQASSGGARFVVELPARRAPDASAAAAAAGAPA